MKREQNKTQTRRVTGKIARGMRSGWLCWRWRWGGAAAAAHPGRKGRRKGSLSVSRALSGCPKSRALETYRDLDLTQPTSRSSFTTIISSPKRLQIVSNPNGNFI